MRRLALVLAVCVCATPAFAQVYRWVDKDGKVHYSDKPPPGTKSQQIVKEPPRPPQRSRPQSSFGPDEQQALRTVCAIQHLNRMACRAVVQRACTLDELLFGIPGRPHTKLIRDPRKDANYVYTFAGRGNDYTVAAKAKRRGLSGFLAVQDVVHFNEDGAASPKDPRIQGAVSCPGEYQQQ